jgi:hypothetical protein
VFAAPCHSTTERRPYASPREGRLENPSRICALLLPCAPVWRSAVERAIRLYRRLARSTARSGTSARASRRASSSRASCATMSHLPAAVAFPMASRAPTRRRRPRCTRGCTVGRLRGPLRRPCYRRNRQRFRTYVRRAGLEPARCYPLAPQASASANSATFANGNGWILAGVTTRQGRTMANLAPAPSRLPSGVFRQPASGRLWGMGAGAAAAP